jgi:hypothetical protein
MRNPHPETPPHRHPDQTAKITHHIVVAVFSLHQFKEKVMPKRCAKVNAINE